MPPTTTPTARSRRTRLAPAANIATAANSVVSPRPVSAFLRGRKRRAATAAMPAATTHPPAGSASWPHRAPSTVMTAKVRMPASG